MAKYANHAYKSGYRDGQHRSYKPPHDSLIDEIFGRSRKAQRERTDYQQGYRHGRKDRRK